MNIGVLTAGGDCPGLNAVIRAVVIRVLAEGSTPIGIMNGWEGMMNNVAHPLTRDEVRGILPRGGTLLGTSRLDPYFHGQGYESVRECIETHQLDSVVVIGGDGTLRSAVKLSDDGLKVVGVPKTIDNDIAGTESSFGFDTAVQIVCDAIDRLTTTAEAHNRIMVVEVMGRTAGWIALTAGMAGGAEAILIPEVPYSMDDLTDRIKKRHARGNSYSIVVVAEGAPEPKGSIVHAGKDAFGFDRLGGVGNQIGPLLEKLTGFETRVTVLGHLQRGGTPSAFDRVLATRLGVKAAELALSGQTNVMAALRAGEMVSVNLAEACAEPRLVPVDRYREASYFLA